MACNYVAVARLKTLAENMLARAGAVQVQGRTLDRPGIWALSIDGVPVKFIVGESAAVYVEEGSRDATIEANRVRNAIAKVGCALDGPIECHRDRPHTHADGVTHFHD